MPEGTSVMVDGKRCQLHYFTGKVLSSQKQKETQVHSQSYGTQNTPQVHVSSTTVDHHELFLADSTGKERAFKMVDFDFPRAGQAAQPAEIGRASHERREVACHTGARQEQVEPCRDGQTITIVWGVPENSPDGPYIKVHNHNTGTSHVNDFKQVSLWFKKPWWMIWGAALGGMIVLMTLSFYITGMLWLLAPPLYFRYRSRQAAKSLIASDGVRQLDTQLASVKPVAA